MFVLVELENDNIYYFDSVLEAKSFASTNCETNSLLLTEVVETAKYSLKEKDFVWTRHDKEAR